MLVVSVSCGARPQRGQNQIFIDVGVIGGIDPSTSLALGADAGVGEQSPSLRVLFAVRPDIKLFGSATKTATRGLQWRRKSRARVAPIDPAPDQITN